MKEKGSGKSSGKSGALQSDKLKQLEATVREVNKTIRELKAKGMKFYGPSIEAAGRDYVKRAKEKTYMNPNAGKKAKKK